MKLPKKVLLVIKTTARRLQLNFLKIALFIGFLFSVLFLVMSYSLDLEPREESLFLSVSVDLFMVVLTVGVIDKLIKRSERQKLGEVPEVAKEAINSQIWTLISTMRFTISDALDKSTKQIIESGFVEEGYSTDDIHIKVRIMELAQLKAINKEKLTYRMFAEVLRLTRQTVVDLDKLIARYGLVLEPQDVTNALKLRNGLESLENQHGLITLTLPFFSRQTPNKLLNQGQQNSFMSIVTSIVKLADKLN